MDESLDVLLQSLPSVAPYALTKTVDSSRLLLLCGGLSGAKDFPILGEGLDVLLQSLPSVAPYALKNEWQLFFYLDKWRNERSE